MTKAKKIVSRCESCVNYVFDEDCECYCCMVDLDEDEAYRSMSDSSSPFDIFDDSRSTDSEIDDPDKDIVLDGNSYIGLISFPTLGQEFPVTRGWSYAAMNTAACQYSGRRVDNDLIICAHNYTGFFDKLDKLSSGDQVIFTDVYGREFNYTVTNSELLSGWDSPSLIKGGGSDWDLTLFTCTWSGYSRVTVRLVYS